MYLIRFNFSVIHIATGVEITAQLVFDDWTEEALMLCDRHFQQGFELTDIIN